VPSASHSRGSDTCTPYPTLRSLDGDDILDSTKWDEAEMTSTKTGIEKQRDCQTQIQE
jgi:hypothetical protein